MKIKMLSVVLASLGLFGSVITTREAWGVGVIIDDFQTASFVSVPTQPGFQTNSVTNPAPSSGILGGTRQLTVSATTTITSGAITSLEVLPLSPIDSLSGAAPNGVVPRYQATYGGVTGTGFSPTNFLVNPSIPLSEHFIFMELQSNDKNNTPYRWTLTNSSGATTTFNGTLPFKSDDGTLAEVRVEFDKFSGAATYDFTTITKAEFTVNPNLSSTMQGLDISFANQFVVVPEPSTIVFAGVGVAMSGWNMLRSRRRKLAASRQG